MKFDEYKAFPYPVLRPDSDDYLDCDFQTTVNFKTEKQTILVDVSFAISSSEILKQVELGNAEFVAMVSCRDTYFQHMIRSHERKTQASYAMGDLKGAVVVNPYVVANKTIENFSSPDINPEFGVATFTFNVGDVLAQDEAYLVYFDQESFKPITSVLDLVQKEDQPNDSWRVDFDSEHIQIILSTETKRIIDAARSSSTKNKVILVNSIYFGAVTEAIQKLKDPENPYIERKWAQVFMKHAHNKNCNLEMDDAYVIAQQMMMQPLKRLNEYVLVQKED
ncbi:MAG: hypothetical protein HOO85_11545 [Methylotenera sp.]|nr:hypothetical protein [Methylotenera sp.]